MPRKRHLKPTFNDDDDIVRLSDSARLLYALLWGHQDRNGVMEDSIHSIRSKVYPREDRSLNEVSGYLEELTRPGPSGRPRLYRFSWRGKSYLYCPTMPKHQKIYADEPPCIAITEQELRAVVEHYGKTPEKLDTLPQLGTVTENAREVDGERSEGGRPPDTFRAFSFPSALTLTSASPSPVQDANGDKSQTDRDNSEGEQASREGPGLSPPRVVIPPNMTEAEVMRLRSVQAEAERRCISREMDQTIGRQA